MDNTRYYTGIQIAGVPIGGLTRAQAYEKLQEKAQQVMADFQIILTVDERSWKLTAKDMGAFADIEKQLDLAGLQGRDGNIAQRLFAVTSLEQNGYHAELTYDYKLSDLRPILEGIAQEVNQAPRDATVIFDPLQADKFRYTAEQSGLKLDIDALLERIGEALETSWQVALSAELTPVAPHWTQAQLRQANTHIASFSTDVSKSAAARRSNLQQALSRFQGLVVMPGESVSFLTVAGDISTANGYQPALADDQYDEQAELMGGGMSQCASTLYNAALLAGIDCERRTAHSIQPSYIKAGFDAEIQWPYQDLVMRNNSDYPIFLQTMLSQNELTFHIYGKPLSRRVELNAQIVEQRTKPDPQEILDIQGKYTTYTDEKRVVLRSFPYTKVKTYRVYIDDQQEVSRELLSTDVYPEVVGKTYVGVQTRQ